MRAMVMVIIIWGKHKPSPAHDQVEKLHSFTSLDMQASEQNTATG